MKRSCLIAIVLALAAFGASAQITQMRPVPIGTLLKDGRAQMTIAPAYTGDTLKLFDANQFNALELVSTDTLTVTISFDSAVSISKAGVFFWHQAGWTLEAAASIAELNSKTGSYAKLVNRKETGAFQWDTLTFVARTAHVIRLSVKNPSDSSIRLGEFTLEGSVTFTKFALLPQVLKMIPGTSLQVQLKILDARGNLYPNFVTTPLKWASSNSAVAQPDEFGKVSAFQKGACEISASTLDGTLKGSAGLQVVDDFRSVNVPPMHQKVVLVLQDPMMPSGSRIHQMFNWRDPVALSNALVKHFREATDSVVNFDIIETVNASILFTRMNGKYLTTQQYVALLQEPGWKTLKAESDSGHIAFDYREFVKYYKFDERRNKGEIDEVWVFTGPYLGMYESQMLGPKAFWWNSPPIKDGTSLTKLLSVMGLNYERGVDQAFHSFGHRTESAVSQAYYEATGLNWNTKRANPTPWDLFTRIEKDVPGGAHVGNIHFPPNGTSDYNYGNTTLVTSYAENWIRYPLLLTQSRKVNVQTWFYQPGEPLAEGNDHLGYLRWWYGHLPRFEGVTDGVLNNWWHYSLDYEEAAALAAKTPVLGVKNRAEGGRAPGSIELGQNYPNPFNPATLIRFTLSEAGPVMLKIYDTLGREVATLLDEPSLAPGEHSVRWEPSNISSGIYFYQLTTHTTTVTKKMALIR